MSLLQLSQSNTENNNMADFLFALCPTREAQDAITVSMKFNYLT